MELSRERVRSESTRGVSFAGFDGLRALAAISVAMVHTTFVSGFTARSSTFGPLSARLDIGVAVFFVISGFLLYRPFVLARLRAVDAPDAAGYFRRRFLRIYPAYWLAFTAVLLVPWFHGVDQKTPSFGGIVAHYLLIHIYWRQHVVGPLDQSWTLATEVSFYVFLPLYAAFMRRTGRGTSTVLGTELAGVVALYGISLAFRFWALWVARPDFNGMYNTWLPARVDLFALGMLLAVGSAWLQTTGRPEPGFVQRAWFPIACWLVALASYWYLCEGIGLQEPQHRGPINMTHTQQMLQQLFWGITGFFAVAPLVFGRRDGPVRRFLTNRVVAWLGLVSYGIYLWHVAMIDLYRHLTHAVIFNTSLLKMSLFMLVFAIAFAALSYYALERPVMRLKDRNVRSWFRARPLAPRSSE